MKYKQSFVIAAGLLICTVILSAAICHINSKPVNVSALPWASLRIVLDAGHGGIDPGASGSSGQIEKDINLSITYKLRDFLTASGYDVILTRDGDYSMQDKEIKKSHKKSDIDNRIKIINNPANTLAVSIHQNSYESSSIWGTQTFYNGKDEDSKALAKSIQDSVTGHLQPDNHREIKPSGGRLRVVDDSVIPTVMVECGFLTNAREAALLTTDEYQSRMAFAIYAGIVGYLQ
ncbi:MAG: N-acetylmuramoyl-L-alanine amidase [Oscillospiraceae bacterium]|nr:N-acetylmuramoyl-L-alanine amidase [Oscillospiraceae bacterium]